MGPIAKWQKQKNSAVEFTRSERQRKKAEIE